MHTTKYFSLPSSDGVHSLNCKLYIPDGEIKGLFQLVHGMTEHIERYDLLLSFISDNGYACICHDHLGHGKTAKDLSELGYIAKKDGYKLLVEDVASVGKYLKQKFPGKPLTLLGHSMGSFIVRLTATAHPEYIDRLIIEGTGGPNPASSAGIALIKFLKLIYGDRHVSPLVKKLAFGNYCDGIEGESPYRWLCKEESILLKYKNDPYCNYDFTLSAMQDLITLNKLANEKKWFEEFKKDMPVLIISGSLDPVGEHSKGVKAVFVKLKKANVKDVRLKLYEGARHEIHNDFCKDEVFSDILRFVSEN